MGTFFSASAFIVLVAFATPLQAQPINNGAPAPEPRVSTFPPYQPSAPARPLPRPGPYRPGFPRLPPLPPPFDLKTTTNPADCTQHGGFGGGLACKAALPAGQLALTWNWIGAVPILGFHIYRVTPPPRHYTPVGQAAPGWSRTLIGTQQNGAAVTMFVADPATSASAKGSCFAATAFGPIRESILSVPYCIGANATIQTMTLSPAHVWSIDEEVGSDQNPNAVLIEKASNSNTLLVIGWRSWPHSDEWGEGELYFSLPNLSGKTIDAARLSLHVDFTYIGTQPSAVNTDTTTSCLTDIGVAQNEWWVDNNHDLRQTGLVTTSEMTGPQVSFDVTPIVRNWAAGQENNGFYLQGRYADRTTNAPTDGSTCLTTYRSDDMSLIIQYH